MPFGIRAQVELPAEARRIPHDLMPGRHVDVAVKAGTHIAHGEPGKLGDCPDRRFGIRDQVFVTKQEIPLMRKLAAE